MRRIDPSKVLAKADNFHLAADFKTVSISRILEVAGRNIGNFSPTRPIIAFVVHSKAIFEMQIT